MNLTLQVSDIAKSYNGNTVLDHCSFSFDAVGTYVLTGPNGCGKSTFLRICALIEQPDTGSVTLYSEGSTLKETMDVKRRMTLVLPKVGVFNTTVMKNAAYGLRIRDIDKASILEKTHRALEFVGLAHKSHQNALTLSSGETKRLGIARALVIEPDILFLDEPTASVDSKNTKIIETILGSLKSDNQSIVVIATHDNDQAKRLADRLLVMKDGRICEMGGSCNPR
ncbi:MAG TPA: ATP-binding cassette domain-containing protein [Dissulfurispiraceae bacterium]|nr:ATP-binding cassette domain-containing protein [Dissulfurispiraceae bacterium]